MSDAPKPPPGFLRKVARFVANPTTDWAELSTPPEDGLESEYAKSEIKAMVERKRRNDFVRKREFDMLRKIRRDGVSGGDLIGSSSNLDSESRVNDSAKPDREVKAKIDAIEQQMVGESLRKHAASQSHTPSFYNATTLPASMEEAPSRERFDTDTISSEVIEAARSASAPPNPVLLTAAVSSPSPSPAAPLNVHAGTAFTDPLAMDVSEVVHDPELDEAVIAFANADFDQCEKSLTALIEPGGRRSDHPETWMVLFDLYRATDQHAKFEPLALDYAQRFGQSAPQWFSLPKQVAQANAEAAAAAAAEATKRSTAAKPNAAQAAAAPTAGWVSPATLDEDALAQLRAQVLQMPLPWVLDWSALEHIDPQACHQLSLILRGWAAETYEMRWIGSQHLQNVLQDAAPTGTRDADPAYWLLRLDVLRLLGRSDQFDEVAIDYCVTYEVSPPSWEAAKCKVVNSEEHAPTSTTAAQLSKISDVSTSFVESRFQDEPAMLEVASLELSGQLVGDIGPILTHLDESLGHATVLNITCSHLIRVDFIAAGDLLNWVLARRGENRTIQLEEANRLVALFFGAMGINEHARVRLRNV
jgi:ABC-type transporter Mla MlaB component